MHNKTKSSYSQPKLRFTTTTTNDACGSMAGGVTAAPPSFPMAELHANLGHCNISRRKLALCPCRLQLQGRQPQIRP